MDYFIEVFGRNEEGDSIHQEIDDVTYITIETKHASYSYKIEELTRAVVYRGKEGDDSSYVENEL